MLISNENISSEVSTPSHRTLSSTLGRLELGELRYTNGSYCYRDQNTAVIIKEIPLNYDPDLYHKSKIEAHELHCTYFGDLGVIQNTNFELVDRNGISYFVKRTRWLDNFKTLEENLEVSDELLELAICLYSRICQFIIETDFLPDLRLEVIAKLSRNRFSIYHPLRSGNISIATNRHGNEVLVMDSDNLISKSSRGKLAQILLTRTVRLGLEYLIQEQQFRNSFNNSFHNKNL